MPKSYEKKVTAGFRLLTKRLGAGWSKKVRLGTLDQDHLSTCILGQLYGSYEDGLIALIGRADIHWYDDEAESYARRYGFAAIEGEDYAEPVVKKEWAALTEEWKRQLRLHRAAAKAAA